DASHCCRNRKLALRDLARPAAVAKLHMSVREGELQIGHRTMIGRGGPQDIWILLFALGIARASYSRAFMSEHRLIALLAGGCCRGAQSGGDGEKGSSIWRVHGPRSSISISANACRSSRFQMSAHR